ncbi:hypothetical protein WA026_012406 [Henosepilachna vigintioctopunctata]|uniref:Tudor domain-containing protein n=1 Tax=Henosepilachna vigintioctopunctata TaxID=420089 RepID=A0AAW1UQ73_9CUCU
MEETKRVLRIILITARTSLTVQDLTETYKQVTGCDIPLDELGYWDLFDFLSDLPDILIVKGNTLNSEVTLSQPKKASSQKDKKVKNRGFYEAGKSRLSRLSPSVNLNLNRYTRLSEVNDTKKRNHCSRNDNKSKKSKENNHNEIPENSNSDDVDENVRLTVCTFGEFMREQGYFPERNKRRLKNNTIAKSDKEIEEEEKNQRNGQNDTRNDVLASRVPKYFQDKLSELIGEFDEGIWCTQLPNKFKEKFGRELPFERMGFRYLIILCRELEHIFHCRKESACDYMLYDARRPMPKRKYYEEVKPTRVVDEKEWHVPSDMYVHLFPEGAVDIGVEIPRDHVTADEYEAIEIDVVAAEIYDPSKFWLYRDDGRLEALTTAMNTFYAKNRDRFRIPKQFLEIGRYCVAVALKQYHRCVIVKIQPNASFVNVFYIDYGSLEAVPKDQIWFLTKDFVKLPAQAIRARLSSICPPRKHIMWSSEATNRFRQLADMMHLKARIVKISLEEDCIEVCMRNPASSPVEDINSILVEEGHAYNEYMIRKKKGVNIDCLPNVESVHLLPKFEEIEQWLVPSVEEIEKFCQNDLAGSSHCCQFCWQLSKYT